MSNIYHGRGNEALYDDYMDFINYVFGFNGNREDFKKLLPKLYRPEDRPVEHSYITLDDGRIKAAVGAFDHELRVCGTNIVCRGIGNVAVHPYARSKGYMKALMNMALEDMVKDGVDLSILGGRRQRYNYFSYEKSGTAYTFLLNDDNMRHVYGSDRSAYHTLEVKRVERRDVELLASICRQSAIQKYAPQREADKIYEILVSWQHTPYAFLKNGEFVGYAVADDKRIYEINMLDDEYFCHALIAFYDTICKSSLSVVLPEFQTEYISKLYRWCEGYEIGTAKSFCVMNYRKVIGAFLALKATYAPLQDGQFAVLIHGYAGDEKLRISVEQGRPSVECYDGDADIELEHIDATNILFSPFCPERARLPMFARAVLPLPIWLYSTDAV